MSIFKLPDLGEGLPDAEIREWFVKEGDHIEADQPMVAMETAKAVVDVPAPQSGTVIKLYGAEGDIIQTGSPLMAFESDGTDVQEAPTAEPKAAPRRTNAATVAGEIKEGDTVLTESATGIQQTANAAQSGVKVIPAVRALARKLGVDINLVSGTGSAGLITTSDVQTAAQNGTAPVTSAATTATTHTQAAPSQITATLPGGTVKPLRGVRRTMAMAMRQSQQEVVPVVIVDDADLSAWEGKQDISVRILRALTHACSVEPALNAHFDGAKQERILFNDVNIGLALDSDEGLFVPVIKNAGAQSDSELRDTINRFKTEVQDRSIDPNELHGSTIMLSNFGSMAGRYANPIIVPPITAIIGTGRMRDEVVVGQDGNPAVHRILPLSLSFDHRAITGGEAARFLAAMMAHLAQPTS